MLRISSKKKTYNTKNLANYTTNRIIKNLMQIHNLFDNTSYFYQLIFYKKKKINSQKNK